MSSLLQQFPMFLCRQAQTSNDWLSWNSAVSLLLQIQLKGSSFEVDSCASKVAAFCPDGRAHEFMTAGILHYAGHNHRLLNYTLAGPCIIIQFK
jgi:hypothetical protein